jgi:MFS family permease
VLLANTIQGTIGQLSLGVITVVGVILAQQLTPPPGDEYAATYAFMETAIGLGNLLGGFALGLVSTRVRKGRLIIVAYVAYGVQMIILGAVGSIPIALGLLVGMGIANMAFVVPSQTLFQERTPPELMGRVVSLRFALVFGGMSVAMALGGLLTEDLGLGPVIAGAGITAIVAGVVGLAVRELREA